MAIVSFEIVSVPVSDPERDGSIGTCWDLNSCKRTPEMSATP